jgi:hypothetical protein
VQQQPARVQQQQRQRRAFFRTHHYTLLARFNFTVLPSAVLISLVDLRVSVMRLITRAMRTLQVVKKLGFILLGERIIRRALGHTRCTKLFQQSFRREVQLTGKLFYIRQYHASSQIP